MLPVQELVQDFLRSPVAERRVETSPIIPELDVPGNILLRLLAGRVDGPVNPLDLNGRVERFRQRIVEADLSPNERRTVAR